MKNYHAEVRQRRHLSWLPWRARRRFLTMVLLLLLICGMGPPAAATRHATARTHLSAASLETEARQGWTWPLERKPLRLRNAVLRPFDPPPQPWLSGHRGVDLATAPAGSTEAGTVVAPADGVVFFRGMVAGRPVLSINHHDGLKSTYEPVDSSLKPGSAVTAGQRLGTVLPGHCAERICLHWGVKKGEEYLDPLSMVMDLRPSILLPLHSGQ